MPQNNQYRYLEIVDNFDIDRKEERRLAYFALNDYFGVIFSKVAVEFNLLSSDLDRSIAHPWRKICSRISELDQKIPQEYDNTVESTSHIRGNIAHDFTQNPPKERLIESRELAVEIREWVDERAREFERYNESLTASESLVRIGKRRLESIISEDKEYSRFGLENKKEELKERGEEYSEILDSFKDEQHVTKRLVDTIADILELERERREIDYELELRRQREMERLAENTYTLQVLEGPDEFSGRLFLVRDEFGQPDETFEPDVYHPETPERVSKQLEKLEEGDRITALIGNQIVVNSKGRKVNIEYIEDLHDIEKQN